ncbi:MAG: hypothetical protein AAFX41_08360 [Bacteroidota bacterium]
MSETNNDTIQCTIYLCSNELSDGGVVRASAGYLVLGSPWIGDEAGVASIVALNSDSHEFNPREMYVQTGGALAAVQKALRAIRGMHEGEREQTNCPAV